MTLVIGLVTHAYVFLAADRRVTFIAGGSVKDDDRCKLVSLCARAGIAFTGLAELEGMPTHEWICHRIVDVRASMPWQATPAIQSAATAAFGKFSSASLYPHIFLLAGYDFFKGNTEALGHFAMISNMHDPSGAAYSRPAAEFTLHVAALRPGPETDYRVQTAGVSLQTDRKNLLARNIGRLLRREIGPQEMQRLLVDEIIHTSKTSASVGNKVLAMCIPRDVAFAENNGSQILAQKPTGNSATFSYFEPGYSALQQYGPAMACGTVAVTDTETEDDPSREYQSSSVRILRMDRDGKKT